MLRAAYAWLAAVALGMTVLDVVRRGDGEPSSAEAAGGSDFLLLVAVATLASGALVLLAPGAGAGRRLVVASLLVAGLSLLLPGLLGPILQAGSLVGPGLRLAGAAVVSILAAAAATTRPTG